MLAREHDMIMGARSMRLDLPWPPSLNRLFRTVLIGVCGNCRRRAHATLYKSQEYQDYVTQLRLALLEHEAEHGPLVRIARPSDVELTAHFYRRRRSGDLDNMLKALLDLLTEQLYDDDGQVCALHAYRHDDKARPRVELEVRELAAEQPVQAGLLAAPVSSRPPLRENLLALSPDEPWTKKLRRLAQPNVVSNRSDDPEAA